MDQRNHYSQIDSKEMDMLLADFFFACNIPFVIVESDYFKNFVHALNPKYNIPTRKTLATSILDRRYNMLLDSVKQHNSTDGVLLLDGWKNSSANTKNVVSMIRLHDTFILLESFNYSSKKETADNLIDVVEKSRTLANERFNINLYAVVTDNASNMMSMGRKSELWHTTCNSHSGNLLCKAMIDSTFAGQVNALLKEFKSPNLENLLVEAGGSKIILAGDTRWCSYRDSFRRVLRNFHFMRLVVDIDGVFLSQSNTNFLSDPNLETKLQDHLIMIDPICELVRKCEKNTTNIADATEFWLQLNLPAINAEFEILIENRKIKVINKYGLAANFLHPVYQGLKFSNSEENLNKMNNFFVENLTIGGLVELQNYKNKSGAFKKIFDNKYLQWDVFWKVARNYCPELATLAFKIHNICASTGELERLFSQWAYVHDPRRNRLTHERSAKLISLYYSLRIKDNNNYENVDE